LITRPCNDYPCYGALEIVGAITFIITIFSVDAGRERKQIHFGEFFASTAINHRQSSTQSGYAQAFDLYN